MCFRLVTRGSTPYYRRVLPKVRRQNYRENSIFVFFDRCCFFFFDIVFEILFLIEYELWKIYLMYRPD